jgi:hypothetical protein
MTFFCLMNLGFAAGEAAAGGDPVRRYQPIRLSLDVGI